METREIKIEDGSLISVNEEQLSMYVKIKDVYYNRYGNSIVKVEGKYYRKNSSLICKSICGKYILKKNAVKIEDSTCFADKNDMLTFVIGGKHYHKSIHIVDRYNSVCRINDAIKDYISKEFLARENTIKLIRKPGEPYIYVDKKNAEGLRYCSVSNIYYGEQYPYHYKIMNGKPKATDLIINHRDFNKYVNTKRASAIIKWVKDSGGDINNLAQTSSMEYCFFDKEMLSNGEIVGIKILGCDFNILKEEANIVLEKVKSIEADAIKKQNDNAKRLVIDNEGENDIKVLASTYSEFNSELFGAVISDDKNEKTRGLDYTFGVEIETKRGFPPKEELSKLPIRVVRDGSVDGGEFVIGILHGDAGVSALNSACKLLADNCIIDERCGIHVHIGLRQKMTRLQSLRMLNIGLRIENSVFKMMPSSRRSNNYCRWLNSYFRLEDINEDSAVKRIHGDIKEGVEKNKVNRYTDSRYFWLNLVNCLSNSEKNTIEFRCHSASTNFIKINYWVSICMAIVELGINSSKYSMEEIEKVKSIIDVIELVYKENSKDIVEYITQRTSKFN